MPSNASSFPLNPPYFKDDFILLKGVTASLIYCCCNYLNKIPLKRWISKTTLLVWTVDDAVCCAKSLILLVCNSLLYHNAKSSEQLYSNTLLHSDFASVFITISILIESAPEAHLCRWLSASILYAYLRLDKQFLLLCGWCLVIAQHATYLFSTQFAGTKSDCDVINILLQKHVITWKYFLMCFDDATGTWCIISVKFCQCILRIFSHKGATPLFCMECSETHIAT